LTLALPHQVTVVQGSFAIGAAEDDVLVTILGSCVATCLWDPVARIGGLNHFLLPEGRGADQSSLKYGLNLMELLMNALLKKGARRDRLQGKIFGGGRMIAGMANIGAMNGAFAERFLNDEGIACVSKSIGGDQARKVRFWPYSGRAQQMLLARAWGDDLRLSAESAATSVTRVLPISSGNVDLF
jgi:chemotaxis protein CheD